MQVVSTERPEYISIMGKYTVEDCPGHSLPLWRITLCLANYGLPGDVGHLKGLETSYCDVNVLQSEAALLLWQNLFSILPAVKP